MQHDHFVFIKSVKDKSDLRMTSYSLNKEVCVIDFQCLVYIKRTILRVFLSGMAREILFW